MKTTAILIVSLFATGCASVPSSYRPIVDTKGVDPSLYEMNLGECRNFAAQIDQADNAAAGAVAGAVFAGVLGAVLGLRGNDLARVAAAGAAVQGTRSAAYAGLNQMQIIQRCMAGRGYSVLG